MTNRIINNNLFVTYCYKVELLYIVQPPKITTTEALIETERPQKFLVQSKIVPIKKKSTAGTGQHA